MPEQENELIGSLFQRELRGVKPGLEGPEHSGGCVIPKRNFRESLV